MGRMLQIRVTVSTYDEAEAQARYKKLYALAWPVEATGPDGSRGLLELVGALDDRVRLGDLPPAERSALLPGVGRVVAIRQSLEAALGERDPRAADKLTYELEDTLAELEKLAPKP